MKKTIGSKPISPSQTRLEITPEANDLWKGIGGHFETLCQVLCEFIDNSISNLSANNRPNRLITITLDEIGDGSIAVSLEDNGTGIRNLTAALKVGDTSNRESQLNEHGFGLKHALAHANPENDTWRIVTRTQDDVSNRIYKIIKAPYAFPQIVKSYSEDQSPWPGNYDDTGTLIYFECSQDLFNTLRTRIKGQPGFMKCLDYLCEDLGFTYYGHIISKKVAIKIISSAIGYEKTVEPVEPRWKQGFPKIEDTHHDLGGGDISIFIKYGIIEKGHFAKYYKANQATSGAEIRFNGRAMGSGLFTEIWGLEVHNQYNSFLVIVDLRGDDRTAFPKTVTSKTRPRSDDKKLKELFTFIRKMIPSPVSEENMQDWSTNELIQLLASKIKEKLVSKPHKIEDNYHVFKSLDASLSIDLYVYDGKKSYIYKVKKETANIRDAYDLMMFWDGLVADGGWPDCGILVASGFAKGVKKLLDIINEMIDHNGNQYKMTLSRWSEQGVAMQS